VRKRLFLRGETVVIACENCEPETAKVLCARPLCIDCGGPTYQVQLQDDEMVVECCASIMRPLN